MSITHSLRLFALSLTCALTGCDSGQQKVTAEDPPPASVRVASLVAQPIFMETTLPGRVTALKTAQIRPQVSGIVTRMMFSQGSEVKAGQALFQIDPAPFRADVNSAAAAVQKAQASFSQLRSRASRLKALRGHGAISEQDYEDAVANVAQARATVAEMQATLERRQLDLSYATVKSPIDGRVDQNLVTEGALVSNSDSQAMATVQQLDRVFVDVRQPASQAKQASMADASQTTTATLVSSSGEPFGNKVMILFRGVSVDTGTGDVVIRLEAENSGYALLPGMYVQARIKQQLDAHGLIVPAEAIVRQGEKTSVWLDEAGTAKSVAISLGGAVKNGYYVRSGLKTGDRLIVQGAGKLSDGMPLHAVNEEQKP